jgi:hypothetical protein
MNPLLTLERTLDIRPGDRRAFWLSAAGAFLVIGFSITARALREAFFLDEFAIENLPYVTLASTALSLPAVAVFTRLIGRYSPDRVYNGLILALAAGLAFLWAANTLEPSAPIVAATTVAFYVFTVLGTLLLTSGFWVVTSERFQLREAKRLFGLISAGGTAGAMVAGFAIGPITRLAGNGVAVLSLIATLLMTLALQRFLPVAVYPVAGPTSDESSVRESLATVAGDPHLRTMAIIVAVATLASYLVDFEFKEAASLAYETDEQLAGFFGRFYGVTGVIALVVQVGLAARLLAGAGVAWSLAILPMALLAGSGLLIAVPGLMAATVLRGADASLRKSLHRAVMEFLWVPVSPELRRRTKAFVDSFVDSAAEGGAALIVFLWVTVGGFASSGLTVLVVAAALLALWLARSMGQAYFRTVVARLQAGHASLEGELVQTQFVGGEFTMTVTQFDVTAALTGTGATPTGRASDAGDAEAAPPRTRLDSLAAADPAVVTSTLDSPDVWEPRHVPALMRLLARDAFYRRATGVLARAGGAVPQLAATLLDENADFVIRRRIPRVLAIIDTPEAHAALVQGLSTRRFEVRYRCGVALAQRRKGGKSESQEKWSTSALWDAIRGELNRERPIWELQKLLDDQPQQDDFVAGKVYGRGELSLEHTFRLLSLVIDPEPVRTAFHGIVLEDARLKGLALEYLEQVLPGDIRDMLWPFIGDLSEDRQKRAVRGRDAIAAELLKTGATLFADKGERDRLRAALRQDSEDKR